MFTLMKKILLLILGISVLGLVCGCQKVRTNPTPQSVSIRTQSGAAVSSVAGEKAVTIDATSSWTAESLADWITVIPDSGERGVNEVVLVYTGNTTSEPRSGAVVFTSGTYSETFILKQN